MFSNAKIYYVPTYITNLFKEFRTACFTLFLGAPEGLATY